MSFLVDPRDVTKYDRTDAQLELFWLFCLVVAGKTASTQARLLDGFLTGLPAPVASLDARCVPPRDEPHSDEEANSPFARIERALLDGVLATAVKDSRLGQHTRLTRAFTESVTLPLALRTATLSDLEAVHGVGPKTARMFLMHTRENQRVAALDTHVLKHLAANGHAVPAATPGSATQYAKLEAAFLALADAAGQSPADYDMAVWRQYSAAAKTV